MSHAKAKAREERVGDSAMWQAVRVVGEKCTHLDPRHRSRKDAKRVAEHDAGRQLGRVIDNPKWRDQPNFSRLRVGVGLYYVVESTMMHAAPAQTIESECADPKPRRR